ncbi:hypothetical protein HYQ44_004408 [Verticillium longisporum]|nr:hypothetical protein HYQ44_004408 [Verticillium longisporum]
MDSYDLRPELPGLAWSCLALPGLAWAGQRWSRFTIKSQRKEERPAHKAKVGPHITLARQVGRLSHGSYGWDSPAMTPGPRRAGGAMRVTAAMGPCDFRCQPKPGTFTTTNLDELDPPGKPIELAVRTLCRFANDQLPPPNE